MGLRAINKKERVSGGESPPVVGSQRWPHLPLNHLLGGKPFLNHRPMVPRRDNSPTVPPFMTIAERERERERKVIPARQLAWQMLSANIIFFTYLHLGSTTKIGSSSFWILI